jgi:hypothetical protein
MKRLLALFLIIIVVLVAVPATSSVPPDLFVHYAATAIVLPATSDVLWGVAEIARYLNQTEGAARWQIERGRYPIRRIGKIITSRKSELDKLFQPEAAASE